MRMFLVLVISVLSAYPLFAQEVNFFSAIDENLKVDLITRRELRRDPTKKNAAVLFTILAHTPEVSIHRMRGAVHNQVFIGPDGRQEAVFEFDIDDNDRPIEGTERLVTDCMNQGSFNFFHPYEQPAGHFIADIMPWLARGNCSEDPTSRAERIEAYVKDFEQGILMAVSRENYALPKDIAEGGNIEALSFLRQAIIAGGFEFKELTPENIRKAEVQAEVLAAIEKGLKSLLADA